MFYYLTSTYHQNMTSLIYVDLAAKGPLNFTKLTEKDIKEILQKEISGFPGWKFLNRMEPAISTEDEKQQLRVIGISGDNYVRTSTNRRGIEMHSLVFDPNHSGSHFATIDELMPLAKFLQDIFTRQLKHEIDISIVTEINSK